MTTILMALTTVGEAQVYPSGKHYCPGVNGNSDGRQVHEEILEHAILAGLAYGTEAETNRNLDGICSDGGVSWGTPPEEWRTGKVPSNIISDAIKEFGGENINYDKESSWITCQRNDTETRGERLAVAYDFATVNDRLELWIRSAIVVGALANDTEEISVVELKDKDGNPYLGISGTDWMKLDQWNTSLQNIIGDSCLFEFSVEVAKAFFEEYIKELPDITRFGMVGHSLGGAVVQHIMIDPCFQKTIPKLQKNRTDNEFRFQAYSFNSIGVKGNPIPPNSTTGFLTSVRVKGEILEIIEEGLQGKYKRRQIGHIYRYTPQALKWNLLDILSVPRKLKQAISLHGIDAVKKTICECLSDKNGEFEYDFQRY